MLTADRGTGSFDSLARVQVSVMTDGRAKVSLTTGKGTGIRDMVAEKGTGSVDSLQRYWQW